MGHKSRIMYIEDKSNGLWGPAKIGKVTFSKTGKSIYYAGREYRRLKGGYKVNHVEVESGKEYWISGCKQDGSDALYSVTVEVDEDVRAEYWTEIRGLPEMKTKSSFKSQGKYPRS